MVPCKQILSCRIGRRDCGYTWDELVAGEFQMRVPGTYGTYQTETLIKHNILWSEWGRAVSLLRSRLGHAFHRRLVDKAIQTVS